MIDIESDIYHCLLKFEVNNVGTLLVNKNNKILGTVTDGDIRKALINQRMLNIPVKDVMNTSFLFGVNTKECKEIFISNVHIMLVPLLTENKELISIFVRD
jgi:CBS domain-containing protein